MDSGPDAQGLAFGGVAELAFVAAFASLGCSCEWTFASGRLLAGTSPFGRSVT